MSNRIHVILDPKKIVDHPLNKHELDRLGVKVAMMDFDEDADVESIIGTLVRLLLKVNET